MLPWICVECMAGSVYTIVLICHRSGSVWPVYVRTCHRCRLFSAECLFCTFWSLFVVSVLFDQSGSSLNEHRSVREDFLPFFFYKFFLALRRLSHFAREKQCCLRKLPHFYQGQCAQLPATWLVRQPHSLIC